jgi:hypothetical protein
MVSPVLGTSWLDFRLKVSENNVNAKVKCLFFSCQPVIPPHLLFLKVEDSIVRRATGMQKTSEAKKYFRCCI